MIRKLAALALVTALSAPALLAQKAAVEAKGIRIVGEGYGKTEFGAELRPFNWSPGTSIALLVLHSAGGLIEIDEDASKFTQFTDDKGTKLDAKKSKFGNNAVNISFPKISKDGKAALVELGVDGLPAKGASSISVKGEIAAVTGSKKKTEKSVAIGLKKGQKITVGKYKFEVSKVAKPQFGEDPLEITLDVKGGDLDKVAKFQFLKPDGTPIKTSDSGSSTMSFGKLKSVSKSFRIGEKATKAILSLELWLDRKAVKIPVDVKVSVGF